MASLAVRQADCETVERPCAAAFAVFTALPKKARDNDRAVPAFEPNRAIREANDGARAGMRRNAEAAMKATIPTFVLVSNRREGNARSTIEAVVEGLEI